MASTRIQTEPLETETAQDEFLLDETESSSSPRPTPSHPPRRNPLMWGAKIAVAVAVVGGGLALGFSQFGGEDDETSHISGNVLTRPAEVGLFEIVVTERGELDSLKNATLASKVEGRTTIISIIPEGTVVKKGDIVCELDSSTFDEQANQQKIAVTQAEAALKQAKENVEIQKNQNESDIAAAQLALELAELDLKKYKEGDFVQERSTIEGEITTLTEALTRAQDNYEFSKRISKKGYATQNEVEANRIAVNKAQIELDVAKGKLDVLVNFTKERQLAELKATAEETKRERERVERKARAALAQFEADLAAAELTYEVEKAKLEELEKQIAACTMRAPQDGEVIYAVQSSRRSSDAGIIEEGAEVHERQKIIKLPDFSAMKVDAKIHESRIDNIKVGLPVTIKVDAHPGETFHGVVDTVGSVPAPGDWMTRDLKHYSAEIRLTDDVEKVRKLRPGLTAKIAIHISKRENVLQIPIQAVLRVGANNYVFVETGKGQFERRKIEIGQENDEFVEVKQGVVDGERVAMSHKPFSEQIKKLRARIAVEGKEGDASSPRRRRGGPDARKGGQRSGPPKRRGAGG